MEDIQDDIYSYIRFKIRFDPMRNIKNKISRKLYSIVQNKVWMDSTGVIINIRYGMELELEVNINKHQYDKY